VRRIYGGGLLILGLLAATALADGPYPAFVAGARTTPAGAAMWGDLWWTTTDDPKGPLEVGPGLGIFFYWYELQAQTRLTLGGGALVLLAQGAGEPGWFVRGDDPDGPRTFELRPLGRLQANLNLRNHRVWLYDRLTVWARNRSRDEFDPFRGATFTRGLETSIENAVALMVSPGPDRPRKNWFYVEATLEASRNIGWINQRAHVGTILEKLTPALTLNLDAYYSFVDTRVGGPGAQFVLFWAPPRAPLGTASFLRDELPVVGDVDDLGLGGELGTVLPREGEGAASGLEVLGVPLEDLRQVDDAVLDPHVAGVRHERPRDLLEHRIESVDGERPRRERGAARGLAVEREVYAWLGVPFAHDAVFEGVEADLRATEAVTGAVEEVDLVVDHGVEPGTIDHRGHRERVVGVDPVREFGLAGGEEVGVAVGGRCGEQPDVAVERPPVVAEPRVVHLPRLVDASRQHLGPKVVGEATRRGIDVDRGLHSPKEAARQQCQQHETSTRPVSTEARP